MNQPLDYKELLKKYMRTSIACSDANSFASIAFDIGTDRDMSDEEKALLITLMTEVDDE